MKIVLHGRAALLRGLVFWRRGSAALPLIAISLFAVGATAKPTNNLSDAEIQGRQLAKQLCEMRPETDSAQSGILEIRDGKNKQVKIPIQFEILVTRSNWEATYETAIITTNNDFSFGRNYFSRLTVIHSDNHPNIYKIPNVNPPPNETNEFFYLTPAQTMTPFARSDFWDADFGLEFFHWPEQKILRKENRRSRACEVLESTNPNPSPNGYSRVDCWIDEETLGIVQAKAYDANGKLLKEFEPKSFAKNVNGQWELQDMEIRNVQTGSRTQLKFTSPTNSTDATASRPPK